MTAISISEPQDKWRDIPREYVLCALRSAALHARLMANEADTIGISLQHRLLSPAAALLWARDAGVLNLVSDEDIEQAALICGGSAK